MEQKTNPSHIFAKVKRCYGYQADCRCMKRMIDFCAVCSPHPLSYGGQLFIDNHLLRDPEKNPPKAGVGGSPQHCCGYNDTLVAIVVKLLPQIGPRQNCKNSDHKVIVQTEPPCKYLCQNCLQIMYDSINNLSNVFL